MKFKDFGVQKQINSDPTERSPIDEGNIEKEQEKTEELFVIFLVQGTGVILKSSIEDIINNESLDLDFNDIFNLSNRRLLAKGSTKFDELEKELESDFERENLKIEAEVEAEDDFCEIEEDLDSGEAVRELEEEFDRGILKRLPEIISLLSNHKVLILQYALNNKSEFRIKT